MTLEAGSRLGPYEILAPLGAGGMGEVYRARDTRLERTVAVKVLPSHRTASPETRQRFEREAKTISQLSHPHICALHDVGHQDGTDYLVMEYLEGETLADRLARGASPIEDTLRYGVQIADALDVAHRLGIVHRDLKPGNVMLTKSGVKLLDFGLAKVVGPSPSVDATGLPTQTPLTQEGTLLGTFQYMAPEQLEGKEADARTDIFALGATLYEMATGKKAFSGTSQASLISAIMSSQPAPISSIAPMVPRELDRVVRRCLAKDRDARWQSARDVALELGEVRPLENGDAEGRPAGRRGLAGWIAAGILLGLLAAALLLPRRGPAAPEVAKLRFTIPPPAGTSLQGMLAISPDGKMLAFVATDANGKDLLYVRPLDSMEPRLLPGTEGAAYPFFSPDRRSVGFFAQRKLKRIDLAGGSATTLCDAAEPRGGSWGSRGTIVFSVNTGGEIQQVPETGGQPAVVWAAALQNTDSHRWPSFLPDGRHFLYFSFAGGIHVGSLDSKQTKAIVEADAGAVYAAPGYLLYRSGGRLLARPFDADRQILTGDALPVIDHLWWDSIATGGTALSASETGLIACQTGGAVLSRLILYERSGQELGSVGPDGTYWEPALSRDGRWLAVSRMEPDRVAGGVWTVELERGNFTRLTSKASLSATAIWSADGRSVAYSSFSTGEVLAQEARGGGQETVLFKNPSFFPLGDWSRDGRHIFYEALDWRTFHSDVWVRDLPQGKSRPLMEASFNQMGARLSPDGGWLAYESDESGRYEVYVRRFPNLGDRRQVSTEGGRQARWSGDGKELFYVSPDRKIYAVQVRPGPSFETSPPTALFQTRILPMVEARNHYDVMPDGRRFLVNSRRPEDAALPITVITGWRPERRK